MDDKPTDTWLLDRCIEIIRKEPHKAPKIFRDLKRLAASLDSCDPEFHPDCHASARNVRLTVQALTRELGL